MPTQFEQIDFRDRDRALANLKRISEAVPDHIRDWLHALLDASPDPDGALDALDSFLNRQPAEFLRLTASKSGLQSLLTVFSYSRFLSEELFERPAWLDPLLNSNDLYRALITEEFIERFESSIPPGIPSPLALAAFRRQQILRIVMRDVRGLSQLAGTTEELSHLADALLDVSYRRIRKDLVERYGTPRSEGVECGFSVLALGKLGGRELNYSSDIDLMFLYAGNGETSGEHSISNKEFFKKVANQLTELLSTYTPEGVCYRVDLRLRPDGRLGELCLSLDGTKLYYGRRARDWELQMLIKARVAAGEVGPGKALLEFVEPMIYTSSLDFSSVEAVSATRERIGEKLASRKNSAAGLDIKLARGGIRDIEFLVQCLQRLHGGREPWVRHGGTLLALFRLRDKELLSPAEYAKLASAYQFLRHLEHRLQFYEDRQTHLLPRDAEALQILARRMPRATDAISTAESLLRLINMHLEEVQEIYERVIHAQRPIYYTMPISTNATPELDTESSPAEPASSNLVRFLDSKAPALAAHLARKGLRRGARFFEHFLEKIIAQPEWLQSLDRDPILAGYVFDIFENSPYFSEQLIRTPELIAELRLFGSPISDSGALMDASDLRRFFRREMFRIQCESICRQDRIFLTLRQTSELSDAVISAAYRVATGHVLAAQPPAAAAYEVKSQMMVIALGRLGVYEFDLGSDADLIFVLPDEDAPELVFWTRVAERLIDLLTAYTGEGMMFAVDTRLRPNGREGPLVQLESACMDYFATRAEAWEGISYMKARSVVGNLGRAVQFLNELQTVDWRRYGQSGRSQKELRRMRVRLEREQGALNPLKAGPGGYYDVDFALMFLRLKGAGIFFKVLNTPERINVIEQMGHAERADANFLRDAATLYRAVDHGLRIISGQAEGNLPAAAAQLELLSELVRRWTPDHLHDQALPIELAQIRHRTREYFNRLFAG
jgi:[glutamine synthetase] adenylyltransferase / [glutamine synthetase]-adenylyl-L-tyrosine phosphorylase